MNDDSRPRGGGLPAEFYLPPATNDALWRETAKLLFGCLAFIAVLAAFVVLTQGVVFRV